jgi:hypothetical protein
LKKLEGFFFPQHLFNWKVGRDGEIRSSEKKRVEESAKNNRERKKNLIELTHRAKDLLDHCCACGVRNVVGLELGSNLLVILDRTASFGFILRC